MNQLRIDNPCPMLLTRMNKTGDNFSCKSCKKEVIDFRNKSREEIAAAMGKNACGIFYKHQLSQQTEYSFFRKGIFALLTVCSFLGFHVGPLHASPKQEGSAQLEIAPFTGLRKDRKEEADRPKKKKRKNKHKKQQPVINGSF